MKSKSHLKRKSTPRRKRRKWKVVLAILLALAVITIIVSNVTVSHWSRGRCHTKTESVPSGRVALLLGTSRLGRHGNLNPYFVYRIDAAAKLYHSGKIRKILISGDTRRKGYNEPEDMRNALIAKGVPDSCIVLDYAGFRTYDSMVRAKKVFGQDSLIVVSQHWHNERALYIAHRIGVEADAFDAKDRTGFTTIRLTVREWLARTKMAIDLLFMHDPHFLGEKIEI